MAFTQGYQFTQYGQGAYVIPTAIATHLVGLPSNYPMTPDLMSKAGPPDPNIEVKLCEEKLWEAFARVGTEMIITKSGRRMFPGIKATVNGLDPNRKYFVILDLVNVDEKRYKFNDGEWKVGGRSEPHHPRRFFIHPDSPNTGSHWENSQISFRGAKLTNNLVNDPNMLVLNSMHKYQPRIHIVECDNINDLMFKQFFTYAFPNTTFIAVTAYQNSRVTKLKIEHNPFAKGFRERQGSKRTSPCYDDTEKHVAVRKRPKSQSPILSHYCTDRSPDKSPNDSLETSYSSGPPSDVIYPVPIMADTLPQFKPEYNQIAYHQCISPQYQQMPQTSLNINQYSDFTPYHASYERLHYANQDDSAFNEAEFLVYEQ